MSMMDGYLASVFGYNIIEKLKLGNNNHMPTEIKDDGHNSVTSASINNLEDVTPNTEINLTYHPVTSNISKPIRYDWNPVDDITTKELAECIPVLLYANSIGYGLENTINALSSGSRRHFTKKET